MLRSLTTATLLFVLLTSRAQTIENNINLYGENFPAEKLHVHFDKDIYLPGETIWFKVYAFEENLPAVRSTNLYIALYDEKGVAIQQKLCPIINATANGQFEVPATIKGSQVICRASTAWMQQFDSSFLFTKAIKIFTGITDTVQTARSSSLHFFVEGGDMIAGERNTVAFKCRYNNGLPFEIAGVIKKQATGEVVTPFKSMHDGMGKFDIEQEPGAHYYAEWTDNNGKLQQTYLPETKTSGVSLKLIQQKNRLIYNVVNRSATDSIHVLGYIYQKVIFKANLALPMGERYTGIIPMDKFPAGVLQVTLFNNNWQPVAERVCFINNTNYLLNATINNTSTSTKPRGKNTIEITVPDTIVSNLSLSVTDADFNNETATTNILTNLLLGGDIKGYIHNPAYYFTNANDAALKEELDLVLLTNGWRRYNWDHMRASIMPAINMVPDNYLGIYGQVGNDALSKIKKDEQVNLILKTKDSTTNYYFTTVEKNGLLKTSGLIFYDTARVYYSFNTEKQYNKQLAFAKTNASLPMQAFISNYSEQLIKSTAGTNVNTTANLYKYYAAGKDGQGLSKETTLQAVVVKSGGWRNWKNNPLVKMDEKYATGMFGGGASGFSIDVLHDDKAWTKLDIFNYIRSGIPGLSVGGYNIASGRSLTYISKPVIVYIDEHEMSSSDLENINISDVAYIKLIPNFMGRGGDAGGSSVTPALSVYTKKGSDLIDRTPKENDLGMVRIAGYSPVKEFYAPDYAENKNALGNDSRTTLLWVPYIFTDKNNLKVPVTFYNNDFSKRIKIVLEGMNDEGKLVHVEKIIE